MNNTKLWTCVYSLCVHADGTGLRTFNIFGSAFGHMFPSFETGAVSFDGVSFAVVPCSRQQCWQPVIYVLFFRRVCFWTEGRKHGHYASVVRSQLCSSASCWLTTIMFGTMSADNPEAFIMTIANRQWHSLLDDVIRLVTHCRFSHPTTPLIRELTLTYLNNVDVCGDHDLRTQGSDGRAHGYDLPSLLGTRDIMEEGSHCGSDIRVGRVEYIGEFRSRPRRAGLHNWRGVLHYE